MTSQQAISYFVSMGWAPAQAAGIVANLVAESNLNPAASGDGGQAYGIAQWHPDRQVNFAAVIGKDIRDSSIEEQLAFVHAELNGSEKAAGDALRACTTAREAGACVSKFYERPADKEGEAARRGTLAATLAGEQPTTPPIIGAKMDPLSLLSIFGPVIVQLIPQISKLFGGKKDQQNVAAIGTVFDTIVKATGEAGLTSISSVGAAVEKMQADPAVKDQVTKAVVTHPDILPFMEVGGGVATARAHDLQVMQADKPFYKSSAVFWISVLLLPIVYIVVIAMMFKGGWFADFSEGSRNGMANLVIGLILGGICGVYYGVSVTQQKQQAAVPASDTEKTG